MSLDQAPGTTEIVLPQVGAHVAAATLAILIWSSSYVATKVAFASFPPLTLGAARFVLATLILGAVMLAKGGTVTPTLPDLGRLAVSGLLGITLYFSLQNLGVRLTTASNAALIVASYPAITALLELLVYRVRISRAKMLGIALAIAGVWQLSRGGLGTGGGQHLAGNLILVATGVVWAFYNFVTRQVASTYPMITVSFYQTVAGTLAFLPLALLERASWQLPSVRSSLALVYLGLFCSVAAFALYNYGLRKLSSSSAVTLLNLVPVFGVLFSVLLLHEAVTLHQLIGGAIVIAGVALSVSK